MREALVPSASTAVDDAGKSFVIFEVRLTTATEGSWTIWRRYSQFEKLKSDLTDAAGKLPVLEEHFPAKRMFNSTSAAVTEERRSGLELWLAAVIEFDDLWDSSAMELFVEKPPPQIREFVFEDEPIEPVPAMAAAAPAAATASAAPAATARGTAAATAGPASTSSQSIAMPASGGAAGASAAAGGPSYSSGLATAAPAATGVVRRNAEQERREREARAAAAELERLERERAGSYNLPPVQFANLGGKAARVEAVVTRQPPRPDQARTVLERAHAVLYEKLGASKLSKLSYERVAIKHQEVLQAMRANPTRSHAAAIEETLGFYEHFAFVTETRDFRVLNNVGTLLVALAFDVDTSAAQRMPLLSLALAQLLAASSREQGNALIVTNVGVLNYVLGTGGSLTAVDLRPGDVDTDKVLEALPYLKQSVATITDPSTPAEFCLLYMYSHAQALRGLSLSGSSRNQAADDLRAALNLALRQPPPIAFFMRMWPEACSLLTAVLDVSDWAKFKSSLSALNSMHARMNDVIFERMCRVLDPTLLEIQAVLYQLQADNKQFDGGKSQRRFAMWAEERRALAEHMRANRSTLFAGYMYKQGAKRKSWKRRLFVLSATDLTYVDPAAEGPKQIKGALPLSSIVQAALTASAEEAARIEEKTYSPPNTCFEIVTAERTYVCATNDVAERQAWLENLNRAFAVGGRAEIWGMANNTVREIQLRTLILPFE